MYTMSEQKKNRNNNRKSKIYGEKNEKEKKIPNSNATIIKMNRERKKTRPILFEIVAGINTESSEVEAMLS